MPYDTDQFDFFVSYARKDNVDGWISAFIDELLAEHAKFSGGRMLVPFFDQHDIRVMDDWRRRIEGGLAALRLFLAFISPNYFASEWCRREWRTWIDHEIAKHILSDGAAPIYIVEVPGLASGLDDQKVARKIAELCQLDPPHDPFLEDAGPIIRNVATRQYEQVQPFYRAGLDALRQDDLRAMLQRRLGTRG